MADTKSQVLGVVKQCFNVLLASTVSVLAVILIISLYINPDYLLATLIALCGMPLIILVWHLKLTVVKKVDASLTPMQVLEQWAEKNYVDNEILPISLNTPIGVTIAKLQQQLLVEANNDSSFDMLLREKALLDRETGIGNREFFNNRLEAILKEDDAHGSVFFIQFKECEVVQSLYGKEQATALLNTLIGIIKHRLATIPNYFIARRSDFELALLLPGTFVKDAEKLAARLIVNCMATPLPIGVSNEELIHIGICPFKHAQKPYQVMAEADMALRSAELQGPSQWFMYDKDEVEQAKGSLRWRTFLTKAIEKKAFIMFFQPVISKESSEVLHHEVLTKVRDSEGKLISARIFLPMAQKCGLTENIDLLVFEQVCCLLAQEHNKKAQYSFNLTIESLLSERFVNQLVKCLEQYANIAERVIIELSEYHLVNHLYQLKPVFSRIEKLGVQLLVDKVGQYVVSARYLKECPIAYIKLHRSIVLDIDKKLENQLVVQSLQTMTKSLDLQIFAAGVETLEEWQTLKRLGVDGGQGHYFTEPVVKVASAI